MPSKITRHDWILDFGLLFQMVLIQDVAIASFLPLAQMFVLDFMIFMENSTDQPKISLLINVVLAKRIVDFGLFLLDQTSFHLHCFDLKVLFGFQREIFQVLGIIL